MINGYTSGYRFTSYYASITDLEHLASDYKEFIGAAGVMWP